MPQHKAAQIPSQGKPAEVVEVETKSPGKGEVLVKNHAWAVNPVDWMVRDVAVFGLGYPIIVGSDSAGEVVEVGAGVQSVKKGDRVLVATTYLLTRKQEDAGFQEYSVAPAAALAKIPDSMSYADATVVPLSAATSAAGLYMEKHLGLDLPSTSPKKNGKKLLVWGAGSSVAAGAIQLAVASGYEVIATSSQKTMDYAKKLGASKVFDYNSPSVVGDITAELQNGTFVGAYDAIGKEDTELAIGTILAQLGGGKIASVLPPPEAIPATVESKMVMAIDIFVPDDTLGKAIFENFLTPALASGQFVPQPQAKVVGSGLGALNDAMDIQKKGVSATKIVVTA